MDHCPAVLAVLHGDSPCPRSGDRTRTTQWGRTPADLGTGAGHPDPTPSLGVPVHARRPAAVEGGRPRTWHSDLGGRVLRSRLGSAGDRPGFAAASVGKRALLGAHGPARDADA